MEKKEIKSIKDFSNLFLAFYALKTCEDSNTVYFSNEIVEIVEDLFKSDLARDIVKNYNLLDEGVFNYSEFFNGIETSLLKEAWAEPFRFNFDKNLIYQKINLKKVKDKCKNCRDEDKIMINEIVDNFIELQGPLFKNDFEEREYITLKL